MLRLCGILALAAAVAGCVTAPPYGYSDPAYGPGYYAPGPSIGVGVGGGSLGGGVGVGVGVGF
ncbi:hypothetical protein [Paraburkholderia hospita]|uniref:hypothetical protein n=1 Tax=Paraburkholderia hospita TaxID=169430 RepID=UPI000DEF8EC3|nr:hypothetical protein [Paraburkholderia hospita]AXF06248.1 hypothetical protein CUJ88_49360 [Paraburkholderia hospita]